MLSYMKQPSRQIRVALFLPCSLAEQQSEQWRVWLGSRGAWQSSSGMQPNGVCHGVMSLKKNCLGKHNSFFQSHLPRWCKVFVWIDDQQGWIRIAIEHFCCSGFKSRLKGKTGKASHEAHNFMLSHVVCISSSFLTRYEYLKCSPCILVLHVGNYFCRSGGAVCLVTALTSVILVLNCFVKPITLGYRIVSLNCTIYSSCLNRAYCCLDG